MKKNGFIWKVIFFSIFYVLLFPPLSFSAVYQITNDSKYDYSPSLYDGTISWYGTEAGDSEIYYWDGVTTHKITSNTTQDVRPSLYNGTIAWDGDIDGDSEIYYWDGVTTHKITDNTANDISPSLYNGTIAWISYVDGDYEIYYWDGTTTHRITDNSEGNGQPSLYDGTIAWTCGAEICYWDGTTTHRITDNTASDKNPSLYNGTITWMSNVDGDDEIYYWDGTTIHKITDNTALDGDPSLYNGTITWHSNVDGDFEIYYWDGTTTHKITDNTAEDIFPSLYNGTIAWYSNADEGGDHEIYYWDGESLDNIPPVANAGADQAVFDEVTLDGSASDDPDGSIFSYDWVLEYVDDVAHDMTTSGVNPTITALYSGFYNVYLTVTDNEGATNTNTSVVAASGPCSCTASTMYVESIVAGTVRGSKGRSYGEVVVSVFDNYGKPVADATVTGTFTIDFDETGSGVTDGNGIAVIRTISEFKKPLYEFCVDSVVKESLDYDDVEACMSN